MRRLIIGALIALAASPAHAALGDHEWSQGWGTGGLADPDEAGHIAVAGTFFGSLDLGGGTFNAVNFLGGDVYVARFDNAGNHVWSTQITPNGFGFLVQAMGTGADGSIYLAGTLQNGDIDFGGGTLVGNGDLVVAGFEPDGSHRFSFTAGPGSARDLDAQGGVIAVTGYTTGTVDFGGGPLSSSGGNDALLAVLTTSGGHVFSGLFGDSGDQGGMTVALDGSGGAVFAGTALSDIDLGGGPLSVTSNAVFLASFDAAGAHQWSQVYEGDFSPGAGILADMDLDVSSTGNVGWTGQYLSTVNLGGANLSAFGQADVFLAQYDAGGAHLSSVSFGGNLTDTAMGISFDSEDNLCIAGTFLSPNADFGGTAPLTHAGGFGSDFFVTAFDDAGVHLYDESFTGNGQYYMEPSFTNDGKLLLWGNGSSNTDFGGGPVPQTGTFLAMFDGIAGGGGSTSAPAAGTLQLGQNSPNPFNPSTTIEFSLSAQTSVVLEVFDAAGRRVRTLRQGIVTAGTHEVIFDGRDSAGRPLASGVYRYHLRGAGQASARSMVLLK